VAVNLGYVEHACIKISVTAKWPASVNSPLMKHQMLKISLSVLYGKLYFCQVQEVSGPADDTLVSTEGLHYNSDVVEDRESA